MDAHKEREAWQRRHDNGIRAELFADAIAELERELERVRESRLEICPDYSPRAEGPPSYFLGVGKLDGQDEAIRAVISTLRARAKSAETRHREEHQWSGLTLDDVSIAHARHVDVCAICRDDTAREAQRERQAADGERRRMHLLEVVSALENLPDDLGGLPRAEVAGNLRKAARRALSRQK